MDRIKIGERHVGSGEPTYVIAEAGVNHNGKLDLAKELIVKAAKAGASAIKFQNYKAEKLVTKTAPRFWDWEGEEKPEGTQYDSYSILDKLPEDAYPQMVETCEKHNIEFLSTPFDQESADFLEDLEIKAFKIASCDLTNLSFLRYLAKKQLPMIISTGTSTIGEIEEAVDIIRDCGNEKIVLLHCTLSYPTKDEDANLRMMQTMQKVFSDIPIGLSDHSIGLAIPVAAVALGANVIEKHYTVDKSLLLSADHWLSVNHEELKTMVDYIRTVEVAFGSPIKRPIKAEAMTLKYARRSIVANQDIPEGTVITEDMLTMKRPGTGVPPKYLEIFVGKTAKKDIDEDSLLTWEDITGGDIN